LKGKRGLKNDRGNRERQDDPGSSIEGEKVKREIDVRTLEEVAIYEEKENSSTSRRGQTRNGKPTASEGDTEGKRIESGEGSVIEKKSNTGLNQVKRNGNKSHDKRKLLARTIGRRVRVT